MKVRKIPDVLFEAQGGICFHCGLKMENISDSGPGVVGQGGWTREHLKARAMNGRNASMSFSFTGPAIRLMGVVAELRNSFS